jgi:hypothetical protein
MSIEIIVARYNENLNWILESPFNEFNYTVYNKGDNNNFEKTGVNKIINLPNVGRCDHTFLYHISKNYASLADITIFFPGSINIPHKKSRAIDILNRIKCLNYKRAVFIGQYTPNVRTLFSTFTLDKWSATDPQNFVKNSESTLQKSPIRPYGKWFLYNFGRISPQIVCMNGIFSIDRRDILKYPIFRYNKLVKQLSTHSNPEVGHYVERSWSAIFYPLIYTYRAFI